MVPPSEACAVAVGERLMMEIVVISATPERNELVKTPRKIVPRVRINSLEQSKGNPDVHGYKVQVVSNGNERKWTSNGTHSENKHFKGVGIFSGDTEWSRVLVVNFVDMFVERSIMQNSVGPVMEGVFKYEEEGNLPRHGERVWEGNTGGKTKKTCNGMESQHERKLH